MQQHNLIQKNQDSNRNSQTLTQQLWHIQCSHGSIFCSPQLPTFFHIHVSLFFDVLFSRTAIDFRCWQDMYFSTCTNNSSYEVGAHHVILQRAVDADGYDVFVFKPRQDIADRVAALK